MYLMLLGADSHGRVVIEEDEAARDMKPAEDNGQEVLGRMPVADKELEDIYKRDFVTEISFF